MAKKIALFALVCVMLTGCGKPDAVVDKVKETKYPFVSSVYESVADKKKDSQAEIVYYSDAEQRLELVKKMDQLYRDSKKKYETFADDTYFYIERGFLKDVKSFLDGINDDLSDSIAFYSKKDALAFAGELQNLGFHVEDLTTSLEKGITESDGTWPTYVYNGISLNIVKSSSGYYGESYDGEDDEATSKPLYIFTMTVKKWNFQTPETYQDILMPLVEHGFSVESVRLGGTMDIVQLVGETAVSYSNCDNHLVLYFQDGKLIQIENYFWLNVFIDTKTIFSEIEREGMTQLIARLAGDEKTAEDFVNNTVYNGKKHGSVGKANWRLEEKTNGLYQMTIQ